MSLAAITHPGTAGAGLVAGLKRGSGCWLRRVLLRWLMGVCPSAAFTVEICCVRGDDLSAAALAGKSIEMGRVFPARQKVSE